MVTLIRVPFFMGNPLDDLDTPPARAEVAPPLPPGSPLERMATLYRFLADAVAADPAPVVWAGDCVAAIGVLAGLQRRGVDPTLVWFDAHGDFHTHETSHSGFLGGMPLAMAVGRGDQTIGRGAGLRPLAETHALLVDGRDLDPGEDEAVATSAVAHVTVEEIAAAPPDGTLHVHVDVDVVDPAEMPAMNYPAPGGPSLAAVRAALESLAGTGRMAALSLSLWNPALPGAAVAARAVRALVDGLAPAA